MRQKTQYENTLKLTYRFLGILFLVASIVLIAFSPDQPIYDEVYFYKNVEQLIPQGFSVAYLQSYEKQAPGPLYQLIYYGLYLIGIPLNIVLMRFITFGFFLGTVLVSLQTVRLLSARQGTELFEDAFAYFSIPFLYPLFSMALTEISSMFFLGLAVLFFLLATRKNHLKLFILSGLMLSLSIIGRQHFLISLPAFVAYLVISGWKGKWKLVLNLIAFLICSLSPIIYLISIWKGLVPPAQQHVAGDSLFEVSWRNGMLGLAYFSIMLYLVFPEMLPVHIKNRKNLVAALAAAIVVQLILQIKYLPLRSIFEKYNLDLPVFHYILPLILIFVAFMCFSNIWTGIAFRKNYESWFLVFLNFLLAVSPFKTIHLFSSRYVAQSSHILFLLSPHLQLRKNYTLRVLVLLAGGLLGLNSVYTYYFG